MEKYVHYKVSDFVEDESFVRWVNKEQVEKDINWEEWLIANPSKANDIARAKELLGHIRFKDESIPEGIENNLWRKIDSATRENEQPQRSKSFKFRRLYIGAAAAAAILVLFAAIFTSSYDTTHSVSYAEADSIVLPDGSKVTINSVSTIKYDKNSWNENRVVELDGEGFFDVEKGSKFIVQTKNGNIEVLGTSFNVYSRNDNLHVLCKTGKVAVVFGDTNKVLLPSQGINVKNGKPTFSPEVRAADERSNWISGIYQYKDENLSTVIEELERQLNYKIEIPANLNDVKYSGSFNIKNGEETLSEVLWPLGFKFEIEDRTVYVSKEE